jgi:hypothetical protein
LEVSVPDPAGGGGVKPTQGQQIVADMFKGMEQKKLTQEQQASQLQEQSQQQQSLREASKEGQTQEVENQRGEKAEEGRSHEASRRGVETLETKRDKVMDGFLSRGSNQAKTREAGKELTRDKGIRQHGAQSWTVSTSRQTPPKAQRMIQARQVSQTFTPQGRSTASTAQGRAGLGQGLSQMPSARTLTTTPFPIRYGRSTQPGAEAMPQRPVMQRFDGLKNLRQQIANLLVAKPPGMAQAKGEKSVPVVELRSNLVFVREGGKTRAFKLEKDGSLSELPTDDASETPLSKEAKAELKKVLRQHGIKSEVEGEAAELKGEISDAELAQLLTEMEAMESGEGGPTDIETKFALLLYQALEENKKTGKKLHDGEEPKFPSKKDWETFFAKLGKMGNQEKLNKKSLDEILGLIFRGLFQKKGKGSYLVGDLEYQGKGKNRQDKFAQIEVTQEDLLKFFQALTPGQSISLDKLAEAFGAELTYLMMAHVGEAAFNMASSAERHVQFDPRANFDPFTQARFEQNLLNSSRRQDRSRAENDRSLREKGSMGDPVSPPQGVFANVYELLGLRKKYEGNPKLFTAVAFLGISTAVTLAVLAILFGK